LSGPTLATDPDWADAELAGKRIARKLAQAALAALVMVGVGLPAHFRIQLSPCWKFESGPARKQRGTRHMAQTVSRRKTSVAAQTCLADQLLDTFWNVGL